MAGHVRPIGNFRPEVGSNVARAQPSSLPTLNGDPTYDELPTDESGTPVVAHYYDMASDQIKYAIPHSDGSVHIAVDLDMSGTLDRTVDTVTGFL